ncbi:restriction endonuclease subunit S [Pseudomonas sp. JS3066]|uniref:restriction endonuclease subunit S n=1 Tax=Pseudomonas sp. JS3066 TaxID=3090665 RepID=UPI002E7C00DA|nr:restriction endonuclease subunit S [Pseudomonas sp. JS3066]WVK93613.1 restriction endonuclease subunit S [Pseudomonas sp. JS3066]WVK93630.1 restriction endonuclease subunit S [Pseudomonas sp. JS3066]
MSELPASWSEVEIGQIADVVSGGTPNANEPENFAIPGEGIAWLTPADLSGYTAKEISHGARDLSEQGYQSCSAKLMPKGSLLFSSRAPIGYVAVAANPISTNQGFKSFVFPDDVDSSYAFYYLKSIRSLADSLGTGTTFKELSGTAAKTLPFLMAPKAEQTRIAQKLDELLAQVDTLKARIDAIPALLKRFRQSVLAAAVSGRLTEEWRTQHVGWVDEESPVTAPTSSSLPVGWSSKTAGDICGFITKGTTPSKENMSTGHGEIPYIKVYNLTFTGALDFSIDPTFVDSSTHSTDLKRSIVKPGDVLMNIVGPPLGKVSIVPATYPEWNINQAIARFRAGDEISAAYLALCLRTEEVLSHAVSRAKATAGQFNLTLEICRELPLPVPPAEEQTEIVRRVEQLFAFADQLEAKAASAKSRIDHLTQSILAKAFRGELVPQDPNDEPASVLLERIKAQRATAPKTKRARKNA